MYRKNTKKLSRIVFVAVLAGSLVGQVKPTMGRPGSIMSSTASPSVGAPPQEKRDIGAGEAGYASRTGAFEYSYPITVPPGRLGMEPSLALAYSSQGSLRGDIAANWSLGVPMIQRDLSDGSFGLAPGATNHEELLFTSSMSGGHRLVPVDEPAEADWDTYRAEYDDEYIRYERQQSSGVWRARTLDGKTWYFGMGHAGEEISLDPDSPLQMILDRASGLPVIVAEHQPLTRVIDKFGNTIRYYWEADVERYTDGNPGQAVDLRLVEIRYSENPGAGLASHARVKFDYAPPVYCSSSSVPVGASLSYRGGERWFQGSRRLKTITTHVEGQVDAVRHLQLDISDRCPTAGGGHRRLDAIRVVDPVSLADLVPAVSFNYGAESRNFGAPPASFGNIPNSVNSGSPDPNALIWGKAHGYDTVGQDLKAEPTLEQTLLDFNGDGLLDMLRSPPGGDCSFEVYENDGTGIVGPPMSINFPYEGLLWADGTAGPTGGPGEGCSLSGRRTLWQNTNGPCDDHYGNYLDHRFIDMNNDGLPDLVTSIRVDGQRVDPNFSDVPGVSDVLGVSSLSNEAGPAHGWPCAWNMSNFAHQALVPPCPEGTQCADCTFADQSQLSLSPLYRECGASDLTFRAMSSEQVAGGTWVIDEVDGSCGASSVSLMRKAMYPWMVYYNTGGDLQTTFIPGSPQPTDPQRVWSPIPLDPAGSESSVGSNNGGGISSSEHAVMDITGDGVVDAVVVSSNEGFPYWSVFAGQVDETTGQFTGFATDEQWWTVPEGAKMSSATGSFDGVASQTRGLSQLVDINGDGLPDLLQPNSFGNGLVVAYNMGSGFCAETGFANESALSRTGFEPVSEYCVRLADGGCVDEEYGAFNGPAVGKSLSRLVDVDNDGLVDLYDAWISGGNLASEGTVGSILMGSGGGLQTVFDLLPTLLSREHLVLQNRSWAVLSDLMDLDGDGLEDIVEATASGWSIRTETKDGSALRLLTQIDNGHGLSTQVSYKPYNDPSVAALSNSGANMKTPIWVVESVTTSSGAIDASYNPAPDSIVDVRYGDPVYNSDNRGRKGFRGFTSIETSWPHALGVTSDFSVTEQKYDYGLDWSGRLDQTVVYTDGFARQKVASIDNTTWEEFSLFSGMSLSYQATERQSRNCFTGEAPGSYLECSQRAPFATNQTLWEAQSSFYGSGSNPDLAFVNHETLSFGSDPTVDGTKTLEQTFRLFSNSNTYWLGQRIMDRFELIDAARVQIGRTAWQEDDTDTYLEHQGDDNGQGGLLIPATTERDLSTGSIVRMVKPNGFFTGADATLEYDAFQVAVKSSTDELGHTSTMVTDLGTGATTEAYGVNDLSDCNEPNKFGGAKTKYDALGRPTANSVVGCEGGSFGETLLSEITYVDFSSTTGTPAHVITKSYPDRTNTNTTTVYIDGAGRTLATHLDDGSVDGIRTSTHFDAAGRIIESIAPNPSTAVGASATISSTYTYDELGRPLTVRDDSGNIGVDISYAFDGTNTSKTVAEQVVSGPEGKTRTSVDLFGRMVQVEEFTSAGYVSTYYEHDGNDNVKKIIDADGIATEMEHDWLSRRTKVTRGEREWTYAYDLNGNMYFEVAPNDVGESAPQGGLFYTTSTAYDVMDRPTSRLLATTDLSSSQLDDFDAREVGFVYDTCANGKGKLCSSTTGANLETNYAYDWAGRVTEEQQMISLPENVVDFGDGDELPDFEEARSRHFEYNQSGAVTDTWLADDVAKESSTHLTYDFDPYTAAPSSVIWSGGSVDAMASVVRNRAQVVTQQLLGCLTRNWDYDFRGRVTGTEVIGGTGPGSAVGAVACTEWEGAVLSETMTYFDSSEVETHEVYRAGLSVRKFGYQYDSQHQLIEAQNGLPSGGIDTELDYRVGFAYSDAGRILAVGDHTSGSILGRERMSYHDGGAGPLTGYGDGTLLGGDMHAPVLLEGEGLDVAYSYDFSGNVTSRTEDAFAAPASVTQWSFDYDGTNQQREVLLGTDGEDGRELYFYDSTGSRYMVVTYAQAGDTIPTRIRRWQGGAEIWYVPNAMGDAMVVDTTYAHVQLGGLNIARVEREGIVTKSEASFHNGLGHFMGAVDFATGVVSAAFIYGPYGEILDSPTLSADGPLSHFNEKALEKLSQGKIKNGPLAELLALTQEEDTHLRRFNGKEADQLSKLNYYGFRYYDPLSLTWTQSDPEYLFVPDLAMDAPRMMSLYAFTLNNPVRYLDPDGRAVVLEGTNQKKVEKTKSDLQELIGQYGTVESEEDANGNTQFFILSTVEQSEALFNTQVASLDSVRAVLDTIGALNSGDVHYIVDVTPGLASTPSERTADRALRNKVRNGKTLREHGGALTETPEDRTGRIGPYDFGAGERNIKSRIFINRSGIKPVKGVTKALIENPSYVAFGHELLGHALGRLYGVGNERESRVYENTYIRSPRKMPARALP